MPSENPFDPVDRRIPLPRPNINSGKIGGVNLARVIDTNRNLLNHNILFGARDFVSQPYPYGAGPWDDGRTWGADSDGNPIELASDQQLATVLLHGQAGNYPDGTYILKYEGTADIDFFTDATINSQSDGYIEVDVTLNKEIIMKIRNVSSDFKLIGFYMPGFEDSHEFHQDFIDSLQLFGWLRFMDWGETNNSEVVDWEDTIPPTYWTQAHANGVAIATMCDLCNRARKDMWVCVPHQATDLYVKNMAATIRDNLDGELNVYVEYSNETWNGLFDQTAYCIEQGQVRGLDLEDIYRGGLRFYAERSKEIFDIFVTTLTPNGFGVTRILASQSTTPWRGELVMDWDKETQSEQPLTATDRCEVYAVAPYFGNNVDESDVATTLSECDSDSATKQSTNTADNATNAASRGLELWAYEGGQHLIGSDDTQRALYITANQNAGMETIYYADLGRWKTNGGGRFCFFTHTWASEDWDGSPVDAGAWGICDYQNEWDGSPTPKLDAITQWIGEEDTLATLEGTVIKDDIIKVIKFEGVVVGTDITDVIDGSEFEHAIITWEDPGNYDPAGTAASDPSVLATAQIVVVTPGVTFQTDLGGGLMAEDTREVYSKRAELPTNATTTNGGVPGHLRKVPPLFRIKFTGTPGANPWDVYVTLMRAPVLSGEDRKQLTPRS